MGCSNFGGNQRRLRGFGYDEVELVKVGQFDDSTTEFEPIGLLRFDICQDEHSCLRSQGLGLSHLNLRWGFAFMRSTMTALHVLLAHNRPSTASPVKSSRFHFRQLDEPCSGYGLYNVGRSQACRQKHS